MAVRSLVEELQSNFGKWDVQMALEASKGLEQKLNLICCSKQFRQQAESAKMLLEVLRCIHAGRVIVMSLDIGPKGGGGGGSTGGSGSGSGGSGSGSGRCSRSML